MKNCKNQLAVELMIIYDHVLCPFIVLFNFQKDARESGNCDIFGGFFSARGVCVHIFQLIQLIECAHCAQCARVHTMHSAHACISTEPMEKLVYCIWV